MRPPESDIPLTARLRAIRAALPAFLGRQLKTMGQGRYGWLHPRRVTFVFGAQRSGTKMVMRILENSPVTRIFHENHASAFREFQLRSDAVLRLLILANPAPCQVFKPICDSQRADELLANFEHARGIWVYRHHDDVANSAAVKWGEHQREVVRAVADGRLEVWGWRTSRLPAETIAAVRAVVRPDLTPAEGALLFWYLRNSFYFTLGLDRHPRMLLVQYEALVHDPARLFGEVYAQVGAAMDVSWVERVRADSVGRGAPPAASPEIRALCGALQARLDACFGARMTPAPVRSLFLINTLGVGGAERYVVTAANWMASHGSEVSVAASPGGELRCELRPDVRFLPVELRRVRGRLPLAAIAVARAERQAPSVVIANSLAMAWVARIADPLHRTGIISVAHGWPAADYRTVGPLLRVADRVVAVSPEVRARLVAAGFPPERCDVVFNGVDLRGRGTRMGQLREAARASMGAGPEHVLVVAVGRLTSQKAHHHVVTIAERLRDLPIRFALIGTGVLAEDLAAQIVDRGLKDRVRLTGLRADVPDLLGSADIYLSTSDWEGMSLTIIEAMAASLPVVGTRTEGSTHLVTPECGVLTEIGDTAAMAEAIWALAEDADRRSRLGAAAALRAHEHFSHERMMRELLAVIARV